MSELNLTGAGLVSYAKSKIGTPYFYGSKMNILTEDYMQNMHKLYPKVVTLLYMAKARLKKQVGITNTDCSGLIYGYTRKNLGSAQLFQKAYVRMPISEWKKFGEGVVLWRNGHVGIYSNPDGSPVVYEAKGIDYGTVCSRFDPDKWTYGITFDWIKYTYAESATGNAVWRGKNPFLEPTMYITSNANAKKKKIKNYFSSGEGVKWLQWELCQAGYYEEINRAGGIDGECGPATVNALIKFQRSCKIADDGICGPATRKYLKANV